MAESQFANQSVAQNGQIPNQNAGYEGNHPYAKFSFSGERGSKSKFRAGVVWTNQGANGSEKANRSDLAQSVSDRVWLIYDDSSKQINLEDRVRVTGWVIDACTLKVDKIERL